MKQRLRIEILDVDELKSENKWEEIFQFLLLCTFKNHIVITTQELPRPFIEFVEKKGYKKVEVRRMEYQRKVKYAELFVISLTSLFSYCGTF
jgi:hypothetical protein